MNQMTEQDYLVHYDYCELILDAKKLHDLSFVVKVIRNYHGTYKVVQEIANVPWVLVAAIHFRESSINFKCHLHNGDPLTDRTTHKPRGRPFTGKPPFMWVESAVDALSDAWRPDTWSVPGCLEFLERYNGLGYQRRGIFTPYLWNFTDKYTSGLFVADGVFDPDKVESRPGCVAILKTLEKKGAFSFDEFRRLIGSDSTSAKH